MEAITIRHHDVAEALYLNGNSTKEISQTINVTSRQVRNILRNRNVDMSGRRRTNGYKIDEDYFKTWTNEMAYVLGFVFTDGNISGSTLTISQNERYILERLNGAMSSTYRISEKANGVNPLYTLGIYRKEITEDLFALGVTEGKSHTMTFPDVPDEYMSHFLRGVVDGDGWVYAKGYTMNVTNASELFSRGLFDELRRRGYNVRLTEPTKHANAYRVVVSGKADVLRMGDWLYEDCGNLYLARKYERFITHKETPSHKESA